MGGRESSAIQVNFNHSNLFYFAGEKIIGNISFPNTMDRSMLKGIALEFIGEIGYETQEPSPHHDDLDSLLSECYSIHHRILFINTRLPIVSHSNEQDNTILDHDHCAWPFTFLLSEHLPPSMIASRRSRPYVKYYIRVVCDQLPYRSTVQQIYPLTIYPRVNLLHLSGSPQHVPFASLNQKKVQLTGYLLQAGVVPGEVLSFQINLKNPQKCLIKRIEVALIQHYQVARNHHQEDIFRIDLPGIHQFNDKQFDDIFDLIVPPHLPPSYQFIARFKHQEFPVIVRYELELRVKAHGMLTDFEVKIPIILGTESTLNQQHIDNSFETSMCSTSTSDYDEVPPKYESVVANVTV